MSLAKFLPEIDSVLSSFSDMLRRSQYDDASDQPEHLRQALLTRAAATVTRVSGPNSTYSNEIARILANHRYLHENLKPVVGVVQALRDDVSAGYISSVVELVHGDVFSDFLEMADHLQQSNYKDAAAVIAGSALEAHLRSLCTKNQIDINDTRADGTLAPKKADRLNNDLAAGSAYSKLDQKSITAWLDLRNKAAHGKYSEYAGDQVALMISGIRDLIVRTPA